MAENLSNDGDIEMREKLQRVHQKMRECQLELDALNQSVAAAYLDQAMNCCEETLKEIRRS